MSNFNIPLDLEFPLTVNDLFTLGRAPLEGKGRVGGETIPLTEPSLRGEGEDIVGQCSIPY